VQNFVKDVILRFLSSEIVCHLAGGAFQNRGDYFFVISEWDKQGFMIFGQGLFVQSWWAQLSNPCADI